METISISKLKAHLSEEIKKVRKGARIIVLDHNHPVAVLIPTDTEGLFVSEARSGYGYIDLKPLTTRDPIDVLEEERSDRW
jgi:prevent-host-death family protein